MKTKNPNGSTLTNTGLLVLGLLGGAMASRGLMALVPDKTGLTARELRNQNLMKYGARTVMVIGGGYGAASIDGGDSAGALVKGAALGATMIQALDTVTELTGNSPAIQAKVGSGTTLGKVLGKSLGLKCPCDNMTVLNGPKRQSRHSGHRTQRHRNLRGPGYDANPVIGTSKLQQAIERGSNKFAA